jgi:hypothetical protein
MSPLPAAILEVYEQQYGALLPAANAIGTRGDRNIALREV